MLSGLNTHFIPNTVEPFLSGHHYCKPKVAVQDKWPLIGGHVFFKKKVLEICQWWPDKAPGVSIFIPQTCFCTEK